MPNPSYSEFREDKDIKNPASNAYNSGMGVGSTPAIKVTTEEWGLNGAPTQPRSRSNGMREARIYAKAEGLCNYGQSSYDKKFKPISTDVIKKKMTANY